MRKSVTQIFMMISLCLFFSQCATIVSGSRQVISIESDGDETESTWAEAWSIDSDG